MDGPSGTGKSTVSREVAKRTRLPHLDTGAYYRAATLAAIRAGADLESGEEVIRAVQSADITEEEGRIYLDGADVTSEIRGDLVTAHVSRVSAYPEVREILVRRQRMWVKEHGGSAVVEGRDIGSVVFPDATVKIYLDADPEVRARRRALQVGDDPDQVIADLQRRDTYDSTRTTSPLSIPDGAEIIDTSELTFDEVVERVLSLLPPHY